MQMYSLVGSCGRGNHGWAVLATEEHSDKAQDRLWRALTVLPRLSLAVCWCDTQTHALQLIQAQLEGNIPLTPLDQEGITQAVAWFLSRQQDVEVQPHTAGEIEPLQSKQATM